MMCEKLCVSIETTKKDLAVVKKSFETYGLELQTHGNAVGIYGTERKKRKAFRELCLLYTSDAADE